MMWIAVAFALTAFLAWAQVFDGHASSALARNVDYSIGSRDLTVREKEELVPFSGVRSSSGITQEFMCGKTNKSKGEK